MRPKMIALLIDLGLLLAMPLPARGEPAPVQIHTPAQLQAMAEDPASSYILMADLDMTGVSWAPVDFSGTFDGNGYAILNLTLTTPSRNTAKCYDGNTKAYEPEYYGLFGLLENAVVRDLRLVNVRCRIESDQPVIVGSLAGYSSHSLIENCHVTASLELRAHEGMFGLGGLVGYGTGSIERCTVSAALICVDTDPKTLDEQFLGGVYAAGFLDVRKCTVAVDGYVSEHGYTHNGGITGLFMRWPIGEGIDGEILDNHVSGRITFFENNPDRRAYCSAYAGEILGRYCTVDRNTNDFTRDEVWEYGTELRPHSCEAPQWTPETVSASCDSFGYTVFTCGCGYRYEDSFTLNAHTVTAWETVKASTLDTEGLSRGACDLCGVVFERTEPLLTPEPATIPTEAPAESTTAPTTAPTTVPAPSAPDQPPVQKKPELLPLWIAAAAAVLAGILFLILKKPRRKGRYEK